MGADAEQRRRRSTRRPNPAASTEQITAASPPAGDEVTMLMCLQAVIVACCSSREVLPIPALTESEHALSELRSSIAHHKGGSQAKGLASFDCAAKQMSGL